MSQSQGASFGRIKGKVAAPDCAKFRPLCRLAPGSGSSPFFPVGKYGDELPPIERIVALMLGDIDVAFPFSLLAEVGIANEEYAGQLVAIF